MEWMKVKLGEIYDVHNGLSKNREFFGSGYPFLSFSTVFNNFFLPKTLDSFVQSTDKERNNYDIKRGDVFITRTSETMDELGMSSVALKDYPNATYNGFTKRLRPKLGSNYDVLPEFIGYQMRTSKFRSKFSAFSSLTTRASLANNDLLGLEVFLPPLPIQRRIASILSAYDDLIDNYQRQIRLLEEAAQRLYKEWFIDLRFPGHENTEFVDGLPVGWKKESLNNICEIVMGQSPSSEFYNNDKKGLPFHQGVGSYGNRYVIDNVYASQYTKVAEANSILFSVRAPVGRLNMTKNRVAIGRGLASLNSKSGLQSLLFQQLKAKFFKEDIVGNGAVFASITKDELYSQEVIVANVELSKKYNKIASSIDSQIDSIDSQIRHLREARDLLLPRLMSGEITINA